jgi:hydrogenase maturation protein HypF
MQTGESLVEVGVDTATCYDCLSEIFDPSDRRHMYAFTNCVNCGPRYTLIDATPYDRARTSMAEFEMCEVCRIEYHDPADRRFHNQTNCCPRCGPEYDRIDTAIDVLKRGGIVAIKGLGGYHLACDANDRDAVRRLRERKGRDEKPLAIMVATCRGLRLSRGEERLLRSAQRPILLLEREHDSLVAPNLKTWGVMLPYAPIHHILFHRGGFEQLVMTSGNVSDEPMVIEDGNRYLVHVADLVLDHNRKIVVRNDDSVLRVMGGHPVFIRRSRGYAPGAVDVDFDATGLLGCGAMLKSTIALGRNTHVFISPYIGDLQNEAASKSLQLTGEHMMKLFGVQPHRVACDSHPDYPSTRYAQSLGLPLVRVQHHLAHAYSCLAENKVREGIAVVYDGLGYGEDGRSWGGEIFLIDGKDTSREHHWSYMPMPGGDACVKYPLRLAAAVLFEKGIILPDAEEVVEMVEKGVNLHYTSAMGRLFDAASALIGVCEHPSYEGQAPAELESASGELAAAGSYDCDDLNSADILEQIYRDKSPPAVRAARFHNTIIEVTTRTVMEIAGRSGMENVCLSGGCFQNALLLGGLIKDLEKHLTVYTHRLVPPNDGGIALGQIARACLDME